MPTTATMAPRISDRPERLAMAVRLNRASPRYSDGPKCSAKRAIDGPDRAMKTAPAIPAMNETMAAMASAGPGRPFLVIW